MIAVNFHMSQRQFSPPPLSSTEIAPAPSRSVISNLPLCSAAWENRFPEVFSVNDFVKTSNALLVSDGAAGLVRRRRSCAGLMRGALCRIYLSFHPPSGERFTQRPAAKMLKYEFFRRGHKSAIVLD